MISLFYEYANFILEIFYSFIHKSGRVEYLPSDSEPIKNIIIILVRYVCIKDSWARFIFLK